jgi:O-antigen ligase
MLVARSRRFLFPLILLMFGGLILLMLGTLQLLPASVVERLAVITQFFTFIDVYQETPTAQNWAIFERLVNWTVAWEIFKENPIWGVGLGNFGVFFPDFAPGDWQNLTGHAHNYYLNVLAEGGAMGLFGYLALMTGAFIFIGRVLRRAGKSVAEGAPLTTKYALALGALGMLVALGTHNVFDSLYVHGMTAQIGLILALPAAATEG